MDYIFLILPIIGIIFRIKTDSIKVNKIDDILTGLIILILIAHIVSYSSPIEILTSILFLMYFQIGLVIDFISKK